jgi:fructokinase
MARPSGSSKSPLQRNSNLMNKISENKGPAVVAIGEALFDCFPNRRMLGGAPVNFIVHMQQLLAACGGESFLISRVGDDELGRQLLSEVTSRGVSTELVQVDAGYPTGQVLVDLSRPGDPKYHIAENAAWDFIAPEDAMRPLAARCSAVCFGTLAQRSPVSRETIQQFVTAAPQALRVLDVNLRQHYFTPTILEASFSLANVVKMKEEELTSMASLLPDRVGGAGSTDERAGALVQSFDLKVLALTRGPRGTVLYCSGRRLEVEPVAATITGEADDVGAGDACCAGLVYGLLRDWPLERTLELANEMGAYVASQPGGAPRLSGQLLKLAGA